MRLTSRTDTVPKLKVNEPSFRTIVPSRGAPYVVSNNCHGCGRRGIHTVTMDGDGSCGEYDSHYCKACIVDALHALNDALGEAPGDDHA
jgi:hypothetical protein